MRQRNTSVVEICALFWPYMLILAFILWILTGVLLFNLCENVSAELASPKIHLLPQWFYYIKIVYVGLTGVPAAFSTYTGIKGWYLEKQSHYYH
jgi:pilus assembly protein TadC